MKRPKGKLAVAMVFVSVYVVVAMWGISDVWAQAKGGSFAKQIQGSWLLVSAVNEKDGQKKDTFGPNPRGFLVLTPGGHFSQVIMNATLPKFTSNNRLTGTPEENQAVIQGSQAAFGTYKIVSAKEGKVMWLIEGSTFPNWDGQDLPRVFSVSGDEMKIINPSAAIGGTNYLIWKRSK
jgi:hypothetical protein